MQKFTDYTTKGHVLYCSDYFSTHKHKKHYGVFCLRWLRLRTRARTQNEFNRGHPFVISRDFTLRSFEPAFHQSNKIPVKPFNGHGLEHKTNSTVDIHLLFYAISHYALLSALFTTVTNYRQNLLTMKTTKPMFRLISMVAGVLINEEMPLN